VRLSDDTKWVIKQHAPFFPAYAGIVILMLLESAIDTAQPLGMKWLLDVGLPRRSHLGVLLVTGFFLVSYLCRTVFSRTRGFATWSVEEKIKFRIRMRLLKHLHELSASYHDKIVVGDLTERFGEVDDI